MKRQIGGTFDAILIIDIIYYFKELDKVFQNIKNKCDAKIRIIIISPFRKIKYLVWLARKIGFGIKDNITYLSEDYIEKQLINSGYKLVRMKRIFYGLCFMLTAKLNT